MCSFFALKSPLRRARLPAVVLPVSAVWAKDLMVPGRVNPEHMPKVLTIDRPQSRRRVFVPTRTGSSGTLGALRAVEAGTTTRGRVWRPVKPGPIRVIWRESAGASRRALNKVIAPAAFVRIAHVHMRATSGMHEMQPGQA